jgi:peptidoglycan hydrolase CwlO-like protein
MRRVVVDCSRDEATVIELTPEEEAAFELERAPLVAAAQVAAADEDRAQTMRQALRDRFAELAALADKLAAGTATAAEQRRALELCCRGVLRLARLLLRDLGRAE